jgi:hypothetical protein
LQSASCLITSSSSTVERAGQAGSQIAITPYGPVGRVLQLMGLVGLLHLYPSTEAAAEGHAD